MRKSSLPDLNSSGISSTRLLPSEADLSGKFSFREFLKRDKHPQRHRQILLQIDGECNKTRIQPPIKPAKPVNNKKKKVAQVVQAVPVNRDMDSARRPFFNLKRRKVSQEFLLHLLCLSLRDRMEQRALRILHSIDVQKCKKKNFDAINDIFLRAVSGGVTSVATELFSKGFPHDVNESIFPYANVLFPSYFMTVLTFGLETLALQMLKTANVNQSWNYLTPLMLVSFKGEYSVAKALVKAGADALKTITFQQFMNLLRLKHSLQPPSATKMPLLLSNDLFYYLPQKKGKQKMQKTFVETNYNAMFEKTAVIYPLDVAAAALSLECVKLFLKISPPSSSFCYFVQQDVDITLELLKNGVSCAQKNARGSAPLHIAARSGNFDVVVLMAQSPSVNVDQRGENGWTALHEAISYRQASVARYLISRGASQFLRNDNNETPTEYGLSLGIRKKEILEYFDATLLTREETARETLLVNSLNPSWRWKGRRKTEPSITDPADGLPHVFSHHRAMQEFEDIDDNFENTLPALPPTNKKRGLFFKRFSRTDH